MFVHFYSVCGLVVVNYFYLLVGRSVVRLLGCSIGWLAGRSVGCLLANDGSKCKQVFAQFICVPTTHVGNNETM